MLHLDIQGAELDALHGARQSFQSGKVRFVFVSTHHHSISGNPNIHNQCLEFLRNNGAHIVLEHSVSESYSGDGLIVASFDERDSDAQIETSYNRASTALFRPPEVDLAILGHEYESLRTKAD